MKLSRVGRNFVFIILISLIFLLADNPWKFEKIETPVIGPVWNWFQDSHVHLGLDLQGGTQLDYEIDLREAKERNADDNVENDVDIDELVGGVKDVIERRVDALGVAEPKITIEEVGDEKHIVVALPGIKNIEEAKERVGKVVQLEFKTQKAEITDEERAAIEGNAKNALASILADRSGESFEDMVFDFQDGNSVELREEDSVYANQLSPEIKNTLPSMKVGVVYPQVIDASEGYRYDGSTGQVVESRGFNIVLLEATGKQLRDVPVDAEDFETVGEDAGEFRDFDFVGPDGIEDEIRQTVEELPVGGVSDVIEVDGRYAIVKKTEELASSENKGDWRMRAREIFLPTEREKDVSQSPLALVEITEVMSEEEKVNAEKENAEIQKKNEAIEIEKTTNFVENVKILKRNEEKLKKAEELLEELQGADEEAFIQSVKELSESEQEILDLDGDTGYFGPSEKVYERVLYDLDDGETAKEIYQDSEGIYILYLVDFKKYSEARYSYQMMRSDDEETASELLRRVREENVYTLQRLFFSADPEPWEDTELDGRYFKRADVQYDQTTFVPYVSITFDEKGGELFAELTEANVQKPIAIYVGGELVSAPIVQQKITGGNAQITLGTNNVQQALQEATELARNLNAGAIPAPLKKPNELNIESALGADALTKSLNAGLIGLMILAVYMIVVYRFMGVLAAFALGVYGLILVFFVQSEMPQLVSAILVFVGWIMTAGKILSSKMDGWSKLIFITLSVGAIYFVFTVFITPIVLTLAGVAGVILSIGMAVDANILIFERVKEEFALGKSFVGSIKDGFDRAWPSILDSNVSSLITCAILNFFGTSIIKGFATNLAIGIIVSMFSAIFVTKTFLLLCEGTRVEKVDWLWKRK